MQTIITALGVASPPYRRAQADIAELMVEGFHLTPSQAKLLKKIYLNSGIAARYSVLSDYVRVPGEFEFFPNTPFVDFPSTAQRMAIYKAQALDLALAAIADALRALPAFKLQQLTHVITVSCTGMYAPGLDIEIVQRLGLNASIKRSAINFMGCYGAFTAIKLADSICTAEVTASVLIVCVELCSIHVQQAFTLNNIISNALFADGAAALIVQSMQMSQVGMRLDAFHCELIPQTSQEMAWRIADSGFDMILTSYVPEVIKTGIAAFVKRLFHSDHDDSTGIDYYAIHPGGIKILQACEAALAITAEDNRFAYQTLREYGNMSSPTVLFVLKALWDTLTADDVNKRIFSCAFGPGLTLESMRLTVLG